MNWWEVSGRPVAFWSTYRFDEGMDMSHMNCRLFSTPLGLVGQGFAGPHSRGETNLKESGRTGLEQAVVFHHASWTPCWDADEDLGPLELLALTGYDSPEESYNRFWHHGMMAWETVTASFSLGPVLAAETPVVIAVRPHETFSAMVCFGADTPPVPKGCRLRMALMGVAVDEKHLDETLAAFGKCYRSGVRPLTAVEDVA